MDIKKILIFFLLFNITACNSSNSTMKNNDVKFDTIHFNVVEKKLSFNTGVNKNTKKLIEEWFSKSVKIDGFEGEIQFSVIKYDEKISNIQNGKKIDITLGFLVKIQNNLIYKKLIKGEVNSFGSLTGTFSLKDFDIIIENTQLDLIVRLSRDLKSKI